MAPNLSYIRTKVLDKVERQLKKHYICVQTGMKYTPPSLSLWAHMS